VVLRDTFRTSIAPVTHDIKQRAQAGKPIFSLSEESFSPFRQKSLVNPLSVEDYAIGKFSLHTGNKGVIILHEVAEKYVLPWAF